MDHRHQHGLWWNRGPQGSFEKVQSRKRNVPLLGPPSLTRARGSPWPVAGSGGRVCIRISSWLLYTIPPTLLRYNSITASALSLVCRCLHIPSSASLHSARTTPFFCFLSLHHVFVHCSGIRLASPWDTGGTPEPSCWPEQHGRNGAPNDEFFRLLSMPLTAVHSVLMCTFFPH